MFRLRPVPVLAALAGAIAGGYVGLVTGRLTLDLGIGRRTRPLGPLEVDIAADRETVYAVATTPYDVRATRALRQKVTVLERTDHMVLAAHHTPLRSGLTAVTVETVSFEPPHRIGFRLVRGPVPHVAETFELASTAEGTRLRYSGELGTDLGPVGQRWGDLVANAWVAAVEHSLAEIRRESERRAAR